ncbi:MAG: F0F1 ATP synthase subunit A [Deltaproteobacteria bacterium]|nr:F0F1 ATP synthase subunit A [Deltaproteobacteria bacterium]
MEVIYHNMHIVLAGLVGFFLILLALIAHKRLRHTEQCLIPQGKATSSTIFEVIVEFVLTLMEGMLGDKAPKYFPLIGALFIYILTCNLIGLIPGLAPPTDNINTNAACALVVFIYFNYVGIKEQGFVSYFKHFFGPSFGHVAFYWLPFLIAFHVLMFTVESISILVRPVSLTVRLFGNMTGDHLTLGFFSNLNPLWFVIIQFIYVLAALIVFLQAFVFSILSVIYISLATETSHH